MAVLKLRRNEPLTPTDLAELERLFVAAGALPTEIETVRADGGLGLFVRSLVGLDREAAMRAFDTFTAGKTLSANQIEFIGMVVDHLTERGAMDPRPLYESPFTDINPMRLGGVFEKPEAAKVISILDEERQRAIA
jgi:type I restriction enzyme R subunit